MTESVIDKQKSNAFLMVLTKWVSSVRIQHEGGFAATHLGPEQEEAWVGEPPEAARGRRWMVTELWCGGKEEWVEHTSFWHDWALGSVPEAWCLPVLPVW